MVATSNGHYFDENGKYHLGDMEMMPPFDLLKLNDANNF
jgi:hypothetical protein